MTAYDEIKAAGIPHDNHESDLYVQNTPEVRAILARHGHRVCRPYISKMEGEQWLDMPFVYDPYWESKP